MDRTPVIVPISDLRQDAAGVVRLAATSGDPVYVTQRGRIVTVMLPRVVYERLRREHQILSRVVAGDLDVPLGSRIPLAEVLSRGEELLDEERRAATVEMAAATRRLEAEDRETGPAPPITLEELLAECGVEASWVLAEEAGGG